MAEFQLNDFYRGDTVRLKFTFADADSTPIDITGHELWFTAKESRSNLDSESAIQVRHLAGNDPADDPVNGIVYHTLSSTDTAIPVGKYEFDYQKVISSTSPPVVNTIASGKVKVLQDVTNNITL